MKKLLFLGSFLVSACYSLSQTCPQSGAVIIPPGGQSSSTLGATNYVGADIIVNGNFTIDNSITFNNCTLYIADNIIITVENSSMATLTLSQSKLFSCGSVMWSGIIVKGAGSLEMINSTLEDAKIGVLARNDLGTVSVINNTFNKNHIHFYADHSNAGNIIMHGNTFHCRDLGNPFSNFGNTLESPYLNQQTETAVYGISTLDTFEIGIPAGAPNQFFNSTYGVKLDNVTAVIKNNSFADIADQNFNYPNNPPYPYYTPYTCIIAFSFFGTDDIIIGGIGANEKNAVLNCNYGFNISGYKNVNIHYNEFEDYILPSSFPGANGSGIGAILVSYDTTAQLGNTNVDITNNHIVHFRIGIQYYFFDQTTIDNDKLNITNNNIERSDSIPKGIIGISTAANLTNFKTFGSNLFNISNNRAWDLALGIQVMNTSGRFANLETNKIKITYPDPQNRSYGIKNYNNYYPNFYDNRIRSTGTTSLHQIFHGLYTELSDNSLWLCNKVLFTGRSMYFKGFSLSIVLGNVFNGAYDAFTMGSNAVIGPQGNTTTASDNKWQGNFTNSRTFTVNTGCNIDSPFYLRQGNLFFPPANTNKTDPTNLPQEAYNSNPPNSGLNLVSNPGPVLNCPTLFNLPFLQILQDVVREKVGFSQYIPHSRWISKKLVFEHILKDSSLLNDPIIDSFASAGTSSYVSLYAIENELKLNNYAQAISLSNAFSVSNLPEENYQYFYKIYSTYYSFHQLPQTDYDKLVEIAEQCPLDGGKAVFEARALRDHIDKWFYFYEEDCEEPKEKSFFENVEDFNGSVIVYPNPNAGTFYINNESKLKGVFTLYDVSGKELLSVAIEPEDKKRISLDELSSGFYLYKIASDDNKIKSGKISVVK